MKTEEKRILSQNLLKEIGAVIKDEFVANFVEEENKLKMAFLNGQVFELQVKELKL